MVTINLIPADVRLSMARRRHIRWWVASLTVAASFVLVALVVDWVHLATASELRAQDALLQAELTGIRAELESVTTESNKVLLQIERANGLRDKRAWSGLITLIGSSMPQQCWLSSIATDPQRPAAAAVGRSSKSPRPKKKDSQRAITIDAPRKLRIRGYAPEPAQPLVFVTNLKRTGAFLAVSLESSKREPVLGGSYYRFDLVCEW